MIGWLWFLIVLNLNLVKFFTKLTENVTLCTQVLHLILIRKAADMGV